MLLRLYKKLIHEIQVQAEIFYILFNPILYAWTLET